MTRAREGDLPARPASERLRAFWRTTYPRGGHFSTLLRCGTNAQPLSPGSPMLPTDPNVNHDFHLAAFNQNHEAFRSLNQQMWQIPLIPMTLTGGLWFGVSRSEDYALFTMALLFLAGMANVALIIVLYRLRYVMGLYLEWLKEAHPDGAVSAVEQTVSTGNMLCGLPFRSCSVLRPLLVLHCSPCPPAKLIGRKL